MRSRDLEEMIREKEDELEWLKDVGTTEMSQQQALQYKHQLEAQISDLWYEIEEGHKE